MTCIHCDSDNLTDYPVCPSCSLSTHFTERLDCRCGFCDRAHMLAASHLLLITRQSWPLIKLAQKAVDQADEIGCTFHLEAARREAAAEWDYRRLVEIEIDEPTPEEGSEHAASGADILAAA